MLQLKLRRALKSKLLWWALIPRQGPSVSLRSLNRDSIAELKKKIKAYISDGGTNLDKGLEAAAAQAQAMAGEAFSQNTLILLTDGESNVQADTIREKLKSANIQLFAVGIGDTHRKATLQNLTAKKNGFQGTYIDTTQAGINIVETIENIYKQVMVPFSQMELRTSHLVGGQWSINKAVSQQKPDYSYLQLIRTIGSAATEPIP